jgi:T5SS/PEP-CTERM-associated repeat protein
MATYYWTGKLSTDWADANGTLTNWSFSPSGTPPSLTTPGSGGDTAYFQIDADVTGTGGAENIFVTDGVTVTFAGHIEAGFDEAPDTGLDVSGGTVIVASGGLTDRGFDLIGSDGSIEVQSGAGYTTTGLTVGTQSGGDLTVDNAVFEVVQSSFPATEGVLIVGLGDGGDGSVDLTDNTLFFAASTIVGDGDGSTGDLTLDDSTWAGSSLTIGPDGNGTVTITNGSTALLTTITVGPNGELDVSAAGGLTTSVTTTSLTLAFGTIAVSGGGELVVGGGSGVQGALSVAGTTMTGLGTINGNLVVGPGGVVAADQPIDGTLTVNGNVSGAGTIEPIHTFEVNGGIDAATTIQFSAPVGGGTEGVLQLDVPRGDDGTITGFSVGNTIDIEGLLFTNAVFTPGTGGDPGTLALTNGTDPELDLKVDGNYSPDQFIATPGTTDTLVTLAPCYCPGTLIRTRRGDRRVENLKIGDRVITMSGAARPIKWIGRRSYAGRLIRGRKEILPVCIKAGAIDGNVPRRDLWVSPNHAMYLDGVLIEAKDLVNGASIVQAAEAEAVEYFHVELDSHDVIIAEGALAESYIDDDNRFMFHNARDYYARYRNASTPAARYCAPRLTEGFDVERIKRRIASRAGLRDAGGATGALRGYIDEIGARRIAGWAQSPDHPDAPVCLDIFANGRMIGQVLASGFREDLWRAGIGSGRHAFAFVLPRSIALSRVEVRRSLDGAALARGPNAGSFARVHRRAAQV